MIRELTRPMLDKWHQSMAPQSHMDIFDVLPRAVTFENGRSAAGISTLFGDLARKAYLSDRSIELSSSPSPHEFKQVFETNMLTIKSRKIRFDIGSLDAISASKSPLSEYKTLFDFGQEMYGICRDSGDNAKLCEEEYFNLCMDGLDEDDADFWYTPWAPCLKWINSDGSHRVSTAHSMAVSGLCSATIEGEVKIFHLNREWLSKLFSQFDVYLFTSEMYSCLALRDAFQTHENGHLYARLSDSPRGLGALDSEHPDEETGLLLISRNDKIPYLAHRWLEDNIYGKGFEFSDFVQALYRVEDEALKEISSYLG